MIVVVFLVLASSHCLGDEAKDSWVDDFTLPDNEELSSPTDAIASGRLTTSGHGASPFFPAVLEGRTVETGQTVTAASGQTRASDGSVLPPQADAKEADAKENDAESSNPTIVSEEISSPDLVLPDLTTGHTTASHLVSQSDLTTDSDQTLSSIPVISLSATNFQGYVSTQGQILIRGQRGVPAQTDATVTMATSAVSTTTATDSSNAEISTRLADVRTVPESHGTELSDPAESSSVSVVGQRNDSRQTSRNLMEQSTEDEKVPNGLVRQVNPESQTSEPAGPGSSPDQSSGDLAVQGNGLTNPLLNENDPEQLSSAVEEDHLKSTIHDQETSSSDQDVTEFNQSRCNVNETFVAYKLDPDLFSCRGRCYQARSLPCSCDARCSLYQDCCHDFEKRCSRLAAGSGGDETAELGVIEKAVCTDLHVRLLSSCARNFTWLDADAQYAATVLYLNSSSAKEIERACHEPKGEVSSALHLLPVTDKTTGLQYRNVYCLLCNVGSRGGQAMALATLWGLSVTTTRSLSKTYGNINVDIIMSGIGSYRQSALPPSGELVRYCSLPSELQSPRCPVCPEIDRLCNSFDSFVITELGIYRNPFCLPCEEVFSNRHIRRSTEASVDDILGNTRSFHFSLLMNWVKAGEVTDQGTTGHWNIQPSSQRTKWRRLECPGGLDQPLPSTNCTVTDCIGEQDVWCDFDSTFYEIVLKLHLRCPRDHASVQAALTGMQEDGELVKTAVDTLQLDLNEFGLTVHSLLVEGASQEDLAFEGNAGEEGSRADLGSAGRSTGNPSDAPENPSASRLETGDSEGAPDAEHTDQGSKTSSASSLGEFQGKDTPGLTRQASDPKDDSRDPVVTDNPAMPETWNISLQVKQEDFTQGVPGLNVSQAVLGVVLQLCGLHRSEVDICMQRPRQVSKQVLPSRDRNCFVTYHSACPKKDPAGYSASSSPALRRTPDLMVALSTIAAITVMRMTVLGSVPA